MSQPLPVDEPREIFISHAHDDAELSRAVTRLLQAAFGLRRSQIMNTSEAAAGLEGGCDISEALSEAAVHSKVLVALITRRSVDSDWVIFEMGARWGAAGLAGRDAGRDAASRTIPLLCCDASPDILPGPLRGAHALSCSQSGLEALVRDVGRKLGREPNKPLDYSDEITEVLAASQRILDYRKERPWLSRPTSKDLFVNRVQFYTNLRGTPWDLFSALANPEWSEVWSVSQNMGGLVSQPSGCTLLRDAVLTALKTKRVGFMVSTKEMMLPGANYRGHLLNKAVPCLRELVKSAVTMRVSENLTVLMSPNAAMISGNFMRRHDGSGVAVVNAKFALSGKPHRTYFVIDSELHPEPYEHFMGSLDAALSHEDENESIEPTDPEEEQSAT